MSNGAWPQRLADRCQAVGWQVAKTRAGHFKVITEKGRHFAFASTPSTASSEIAAVASAKRHGLERLERELAVRGEIERRKRIELDRKSSDAHIAALERQAAHDNDGSEDTKPTPEQSLGSVNGVKIVDRGPAMFKTPVMRTAMPLADASELLLEDESVVYRCEKLGSWRPDVDPSKVCHETFDAVRSLSTHIAFHARKPAETKTQEVSLTHESSSVSVQNFIKDAVASGQLREVKATLMKNYVLKREVHNLYVAWCARNELRACSIAELMMMLAAEGWVEIASEGKRWRGWVLGTPEEAPQPAQVPAGALARGSDLAAKFSKLQGELEALHCDVTDAVVELNEFISELPEHVADQETLEKAQRYDEMRRLMKE